MQEELRLLGGPERAKASQRFFKTGKGEYGEGDIFLGVTVPQQRNIARKYKDNVSLQDIEFLLRNRVHELRFTALEILVMRYEKASEVEKKKIFDFYLNHTSGINNWDLVDTSAPYIVGNYLLDKDKSILYKLMKSSNLWEKRIAVVSTLAFIQKGEFEATLRIVELLLQDKHDLIHKACGWMLREIGKKSTNELEAFLSKHCNDMPRTMLRYAIERFSEDKRKAYLSGIL